MWLLIGLLCEGKPSLIVDFEDLLDGVDVGGRPEVQTQVVLACCAHDLLKKAEENTSYHRRRTHGHQTGTGDADLCLLTFGTMGVRRQAIFQASLS